MWEAASGRPVGEPLRHDDAGHCSERSVPTALGGDGEHGRDGAGVGGGERPAGRRAPAP